MNIKRWLHETASQAGKVLGLEKVKVKLILCRTPNFLAGRAYLDEDPPEVHILMSEDALKKDKIHLAILPILIHELCHLVSPEDPDTVAAKYFPEIARFLEKCKSMRIVQCSNRQGA